MVMKSPGKTIWQRIAFTVSAGILVATIIILFNIDRLGKFALIVIVILSLIACILSSTGGANWIKRILDKIRKIAISFGKQGKEKILSFTCRTRHILTKNRRYVFLTIFILCFTATAFIVAFIITNNESRQTHISLPPISETPTYDLTAQEPPTTLPHDENEYVEVEPDECLSSEDDVYEDEYQNYTNITLPTETETPETVTPAPPVQEDSPTPTPTLPPGFIPVTNITGIPSEAFIGTYLPLHGEAYPIDATNRRIYGRSWEIVSGTGASLDFNVLNVTTPDTITIRTTIVNGATPTTDFTQYFVINALVDERTFYAGDIDVINAIITSNGFSATLVDNRTPVTTLPDDWDFITWSDSSPRRIDSMFLSGCSSTSGARDRNIKGHFDVSGLTQLLWLSVQCNQMTAINVSGNYYLVFLHVQDAQLADLDVSNNPRLRELLAGGNQLAQLNISNNSALEWLDIRNNNLTHIDISNNPNLKTLTIYRNQLTMLDISNNPILERLAIFYNNIASSDDIIGWINNFDHAGIFEIGVSDYPFTFYPQW